MERTKKVYYLAVKANSYTILFDLNVPVQLWPKNIHDYLKCKINDQDTV